MAEPTEVQDRVPETRPSTIATPEGDNEYADGQPLTNDDLTITRPRGDEPHSKQPERKAQE